MINTKKLSIKLLSDKEVLSKSCGEVKSSETLNYRNLLPESGGLFCQKIFGPIKDYCCLCNLEQKLHMIGSKCNVCGVMITESISRRNRFGHISLNAPLVHIWMFKITPSKLSLILNKSPKYIEEIVYYKRFVVLKSEIEGIKNGDLIDTKNYYKNLACYGTKIKVNIGADAIRNLLNSINTKEVISSLKEILKRGKNHNFKKINERISLLEVLDKNKFKLSDFVINYIPVLPPDLRPLICVGNNKFVSSDINELYKRLINRNKRLKKLIKVKAPNSVIFSEKRLLQESLDCLFDNGRKTTFFKTRSKIPIKSLSDNIKGKRGRFRQNLLGKRVDYSGRSVIVVNPKINFKYFNLPYLMAIELFMPFILGYLVKNNITDSFLDSRKLIKENGIGLFEVVKNVTKNHPVILNRAPTLHRLNIQAFYPIITKDKAIKVHPLICSAFNADFDGDQMSLHIPLSLNSIEETKNLILSDKNISMPSNGLLSIPLTQDIILGLNYLTRKLPNDKEIEYFTSSSDAVCMFNLGLKKLHDDIYLKYKENFLIKTTIGRMFLYELLPKKKFFLKYNKVLNKKDVNLLINKVSRFFKGNNSKTIKFVNGLMKLGFSFATLSGISISLFDIKKTDFKHKLLKKFKRIKPKECSFIKKINIKSNPFSELNAYLKLTETINYYSNILNKFELISFGSKKYAFNFRNKIFNIIESGSKGSIEQMLQIGSNKGLVMKNSDEVIGFPIISNLTEGMNTDEYFVSTFGSRKGLSDTALKTAEAGYLTRRLVSVSQDIVINLYDCKSKKGIKYYYYDKELYLILGRTLVNNCYSKKGKLLLKKNKFLKRSDIVTIIKNRVCVFIRTPVFCLLKNGTCSLCYGSSIINNRFIEEGFPIGIISAQSIGEPGTQLTMRTFHTGGVLLKKQKRYYNHLYKSCFIKYSPNLKVLKFKKGNIFTKNSGLINFLDYNSNKIGSKKVSYGNKLIFLNNSQHLTVENNPEAFSYIHSPFKAEYKSYNINKCGKILVTKSSKFNSFYINKINEEFKPFIMLKTLRFKCSFSIDIGDIVLIPKHKVINKGYVIKITSATSKMNLDITKSLSIVSNLLEARKNKEFSVFRKLSKVKTENSLFRSGRMLFHKAKEINKLHSKNYEYLIKGSIINKGLISPVSLMEVYGVETFIKYFSRKLFSIYGNYGVRIDIRNFEVIIMRMVSSVLNFTKYKNNTMIDIINRNSNQIKKSKYKNIIMGITKVSLNQKSFISTSSFQNTTKIIIDSALKFKKDKLRGLKENVVLGNIVPSGTGYFIKKYEDIFSNKKKNKKEKK
ncbi:DNA-directed RNA polymerase subunit beta' [Candidatus Vidania fulgoroideorum]